MVKISDYIFEGKYSIDGENVPACSGVYAILTKISDKQFDVVDIGESKNMNERITNHDRKDCWKKKKQGDLYVVVHKEEVETKRLAIEKELRGTREKKLCGERP
jgi:predicted GIY-YIG superfamily endonuclease